MVLPLNPPFRPMLAKLARTIPEGDGWLFEPKWDGFRCIVFRDGDDIELASRNERPFTRYFPELLAPLKASLPERCVVDGEIVVADGDRQRARLRRAAAAHPPGRVAGQPAGGRDPGLVRGVRPARPRRRLAARATALGERRAELLEALRPAPPVHLTPASTDPATAAEWFGRFEGAGLDGVVAKRLEDPYLPDKRALVKVKHERTADCAVAGYRIHKDGNGVGSLLLGLYDDDGGLQHVGVAASFSRQAARRAARRARAAHPRRGRGPPVGATGPSGSTPMPPASRAATSRWNAGKDLSWVPIRVELVAEVTFGQLEKRRFRHGVSFVRWRPDRTPESCRYEQLEVAAPVPFEELVSPS